MLEQLVQSSLGNEILHMSQTNLSLNLSLKHSKRVS